MVLHNQVVAAVGIPAFRHLLAGKTVDGQLRVSFPDRTIGVPVWNKVAVDPPVGPVAVFVAIRRRLVHVAEATEEAREVRGNLPQIQHLQRSLIEFVDVHPSDLVAIPVSIEKGNVVRVLSVAEAPREPHEGRVLLRKIECLVGCATGLIRCASYVSIGVRGIAPSIPGIVRVSGGTRVQRFVLALQKKGWEGGRVR